MDIQVKNNFATYECGCKFEVVDQGPPIRIKLNASKEIPLDCSRTWNMFADGNTKGVFQLETRFGQQYCKKLRPENIEHLGGLLSILRPGCIAAVRDGKTIAEHYIDRKNGDEEITYFHPVLEQILEQTFGEMVYQEQAMQIAQAVAGFNLQQADILRKAIGKKKADIMAAVKKDFLEGCRQTAILTEEQAEEVFGWIEKSQRYSFNKSHAISYAINAYLSCYVKAHFPVSFFTSYLYYSKDKQKSFDEVALLVNNAKLMGIDVLPPDFRLDNNHFKRVSKPDSYNTYDDKIYFGMVDIKGIGDSATKKVKQAIYQAETALGIKRDNWSWLDFLLYFSQEVSSTVVEGMIESGALRYFQIPRAKMLFEYEQYSKLTTKEQAWIKQNVSGATLSEILAKALKPYEAGVKLKKGQGMCSTKTRVPKVRSIFESLINPPYSLEDSPLWIARLEEARLGVSITATVLDSCKDTSEANCTILEFAKHREKSSGVFIACQIANIKTHITKNDDEMAFIGIDDGESSMDCVAFANVWEKIRLSGVCIPENTVMVSGDRSRQGDSLIIKEMWQLS